MELKGTSKTNSCLDLQTIEFGIDLLPIFSHGYALLPLSSHSLMSPEARALLPWHLILTLRSVCKVEAHQWRKM